MRKTSIPDTVTFVADNLHVRETAIRDLGDETTTAIRLFTWHLLSVLGHGADTIAKDFKTSPATILSGLQEWRGLIRRHEGEPQVTKSILDELTNPTPATTH